MSGAENSSPFERYLAIDAYKHYIVIGGLNAQLEVVLPARRLAMKDYATWAQKDLSARDCVVIEASTNTWDLYDLTAASAGKVVVAHPFAVALIAKARVKTDKKDVFRLARLLAGGLIPEVWVPPIAVRELRTMTRNRLHSLAHRHNLSLPKGGTFAKKNQTWWQELQVSALENLRLRQDLELLEFLTPQIKAVDAELARLSNTIRGKTPLPT